MNIKHIFCILCLCWISIEAGAQTSCEKPIPQEVFTPNGDGFNDKWIITCLIDFPHNEIVIYNRWGSEVYRADGYDQNWDGTNASDNKPLDAGTYVFVLKYQDQQEYKTLTGTVTLVR